MINRVVLVGRITRDPEGTQTASGVSVTRFTVACNRQYKDQNGERQADFINCVAWRSQSDFIKNYVRKGNLISIEGRIQTGSFNDNDGNVRYTTDVVVDSVSNLEPRNDNNQNQNQYNNQQNTRNYNNNNNYSNNNQQAPVNNYNNPSPSNNFEPQNSNYNISDDDLPF